MVRNLILISVLHVIYKIKEERRLLGKVSRKTLVDIIAQHRQTVLDEMEESVNEPNDSFNETIK